MKVEVYADADAVANKAAGLIATMARHAVAGRGRFVMAVSDGHTPWQMLRALAREDVPWKGVHVVQVDERIAPAFGTWTGWAHGLARSQRSRFERLRPGCGGDRHLHGTATYDVDLSDVESFPTRSVAGDRRGEGATLPRLLDADPTIPAGRVRQDQA